MKVEAQNKVFQTMQKRRHQRLQYSKNMSSESEMENKSLQAIQGINDVLHFLLHPDPFLGFEIRLCAKKVRDQR